MNKSETRNTGNSQIERSRPRISRKARMLWTSNKHAASIVLSAESVSSAVKFSMRLNGYERRPMTKSWGRSCFPILRLESGAVRSMVADFEIRISHLAHAALSVWR
jgi:hypothetical protein